jgi:hypothetical protein
MSDGNIEHRDDTKLHSKARPAIVGTPGGEDRPAQAYT